MCECFWVWHFLPFQPSYKALYHSSELETDRKEACRQDKRQDKRQGVIAAAL